MRLGILRCGEVNPALAERFGDGDSMFENMLAPTIDQSQLRWYDAQRSELPSRADEADAWLVTGSKHGVYEDLPWIEPLKDVLRDIRKAGLPLVGICFGHQIMVEAFGGTVVKSDKGWGCGTHTYDVMATEGPLAAAPPRVSLLAMHQDQVVKVPEGASTVMSSEFCTHAALSYDARTFSIQPHPEFEPAFLQALIELRKGNGIPEQRADDGVESLELDHDSRSVSAAIAAFLASGRVQNVA